MSKNKASAIISNGAKKPLSEKTFSIPEEIDSNTLKIQIVYSVPNKIPNEVFEVSIQSSQEIGFY